MMLTEAFLVAFVDDEYKTTFGKTPFSNILSCV